MSTTSSDTSHPVAKPPCPSLPHPLPASFVRRAALVCHLCEHKSPSLSVRCRSTDCRHPACPSCYYAIQERIIICPCCDEHHGIDLDTNLLEFLCRECLRPFDASWLRAWADGEPYGAEGEDKETLAKWLKGETMFLGDDTSMIMGEFFGFDWDGMEDMENLEGMEEELMVDATNFIPYFHISDDEDYDDDDGEHDADDGLDFGYAYDDNGNGLDELVDRIVELGVTETLGEWDLEVAKLCHGNDNLGDEEGYSELAQWLDKETEDGAYCLAAEIDEATAPVIDADDEHGHQLDENQHDSGIGSIIRDGLVEDGEGTAMEIGDEEYGDGGHEFDEDYEFDDDDGFDDYDDDYYY